MAIFWHRQESRAPIPLPRDWKRLNTTSRSKTSRYAQEVEAYWKPWVEQAEALSHTEFAEMFLERVIERLRERPAYLQLLAVPIQFSRDPAARRALRVAIANIFKAKDSSLTSEKAMLAANITVHMVNGMRTLYAEAGPREKPLIVAEYKKALTLHLGSVLSEDVRTSGLQKRGNVRQAASRHRSVSVEVLAVGEKLGSWRMDLKSACRTLTGFTTWSTLNGDRQEWPLRQRTIGDGDPHWPFPSRRCA